MTTTAITVPLPMQSAMEQFTAQLKPLLEESKAIVVTACDQVTAMKAAGEARRKLKQLRCAVESCRKAYKEEFLQQGRVVDQFAAAVKSQIEPEERRLQEAEEFAIRAEATRKAAMSQDRAEALAYFGAYSLGFDLAEMPEDTFIGILEKAQADAKARQEAARVAEQQRKDAAEKARKEREAQEAERKRLAAENARLQAEAKKRAEDAAAESKRILELGKARTKSLEKYDVNQDLYNYKMFGEMKTTDWEISAGNYKRSWEEKQAAAVKLQAERKAREAAEAEAKRIKDEAIASAERERQAVLEAERKVREEKERAARAPDKAKAKALADALVAFPVPDFTSVPGKAIHARVCQALGELAEEIDEMATHL